MSEWITVTILQIQLFWIWMGVSQSVNETAERIDKTSLKVMVVHGNAVKGSSLLKEKQYFHCSAEGTLLPTGHLHTQHPFIKCSCFQHSPSLPNNVQEAEYSTTWHNGKGMQRADGIRKTLMTNWVIHPWKESGFFDCLKYFGTV